jgi:hypothetical protein
MVFNRRHLIAPLAIGAAVLSFAGTGAAFAATGTHIVKPAVVATKHTTVADVKTDRTGRDTTTDLARTGTTNDVASTDRAGANDR